MREQWLGEFKHVPTALIQSSFSFSLAAMKYMVSFCTHRPHRLVHKRASAENMTATAGGSERGREGERRQQARVRLHQGIFNWAAAQERGHVPLSRARKRILC